MLINSKKITLKKTEKHKIYQQKWLKKKIIFSVHSYVATIQSIINTCISLKKFKKINMI